MLSVPATFSVLRLPYAIPLLLAGYGDGQTHENDPITRAQIAVLLYRSLTPASAAMLSSAYDTFSDVERGTWYRIFTASTMGAGGEPWGWMGGREGESLDKWDCL